MLIDAAGVAKVADFGLFRMQADLKEEAKEEASGHDGNAYVAADLARGNGGGARKKRLEQKKEVTGNTGSARYMAPEVFAHLPYDSKVDVFSFAIVAYELLSRSRAYDHSFLSPEQIPAAVHRSPSFRPKLPKGWLPEVVGFFESMWAAEPAERPDFAEARLHPAAPPPCRSVGRSPTRTPPDSARVSFEDCVGAACDRLRPRPCRAHADSLPRCSCRSSRD